MSWNSIVGQERVANVLRVSLERGRLAHAYLFTGEEGVGKAALAIELSKTLNCEKGGDEACGECPSCRKFAVLQHPNLKLIFPLPVGKNEARGDSPLAKLSDDEVAMVREQLALKAANPYHAITIPRANEIKVNSIRELRREAALSPSDRGKKVFLIIDAETMNDESSNALLKTLEEPHETTMIILTSSRPDNLLPTIRSRCQHLRFDPLREEALERALIEREKLDATQARLVARLAKGSYTKALEYTHASLGDQRKEAVEYLRTMLFRSRQDVLGEIDRVMRDLEKNEIDEMLRLLQYWLRDAMTVSEGLGERMLPGDRDAIEKFNHRYRTADFDSAIAAIDKAISLLYKNVYIPLVLMDLAFALKRSLDPESAGEKSFRPDDKS
ncbi:MAG TPA: DNA polymerase III subunit delta' [Bacteroidota bacterium]|nr:DNA polymerase III subunit delta' [Bacteroidota bacterium]